MSKVIVCDIDGTLCINGQANYSLVCLLEQYEANDYKIIIATGRLESDRDLTVSWLADNKIPYDDLIMKPVGKADLETVDWKEGAIQDYLKTKKLKVIDIECVFENRKKSARMWNQLGVACFLVYNDD